jgi:hypothetical protein
VNDVNYIRGIALSNQDIKNIKNDLRESCKFRVSSSSLATIDRKDLKFKARYYKKDGFIYFHVTNTERRKILQLLKEHYNEFI